MRELDSAHWCGQCAGASAETKALRELLILANIRLRELEEKLARAREKKHEFTGLEYDSRPKFACI